MHVKRGFTLIELLVVIAIIAILAAILFPVFAQAKQAAKGAASLSNAKQEGLAFFMYEGDYDDRCPMYNSWEADAPVTVGGCGVTTWAMVCMPYMKNADILNYPLATAEVAPAGFPKTLWNSVFPEFGYNYNVWSPYAGGFGHTCAAPWIPNTLSSTAVARPAEVPLLVSKPISPEEGGEGTLWWYGAGSEMSSTIVDPPDCQTRAEWCFGGWGNSGNWNLILNGQPASAGRYTAGNSRRRANNHVTMFGDGHAAAMQAGRMAIGTNWQDTPSFNDTSIVITDINQFRWTKQ